MSCQCRVYNKGGTTDSTQFFLEGQQSDAFCAWQLSQCGWMENGRRASGANAPIVATNLLWWRETAPPWSQKDRIHRVHHFTFASGAVSVFTCVYFPAGSEFCSCSFHLMSLDSKSLHFTSFAFRLALTFCDLALLLRPSLLYQRSVKRRQRMLHRLRRCLSLSGKPK